MPLDSCLVFLPPAREFDVRLYGDFVMSTGLVRCSPGVELVSALASQVTPGSWVRGFGVVRDLVVAVDPAGTLPTIRHDGTAQIASLDAFVGPDGAVVSVVASVPVAGTVVVGAGRLERAIVVDMTLFAQPIAATTSSSASAPASSPTPAPSPAAAPAPRAPQTHSSAPASAPRPSYSSSSSPAPSPVRTSSTSSEATARSSAPDRAAPPAPRPAPAGVGAWAQVAALSDRVSTTHGDEPDPVEVDELERGDVLIHPTLGRCVFLQGIDTDAARVKLPNGSPQKLMLRVFDIVPTDNPKTFQLRKRE